MMQLGERLKEARIEKNLTIDDIQHVTKIQKRYLLAIENNEWSKIPGIFYIKAFIREYASAVDLNAEELLEIHRDELPMGEDYNYEYVTPSRKSRHASNRVNKAVFMFLPRLLVVMLVIAVLFAIYYFYITKVNPDNTQDQNVDHPDVITAPDDEQNEEEEQSDENNNDEQDDPIDEEQEEVVEQQLTVISSDTTLRAPRSVIELTNADQFVLRFEVTDETYLHVHGLNENNQVVNNHYQKMFRNSESPLTIDVSSENRVELNIGRASSTTVYINDEQLEFPVDPNEKVHQFITIIWSKDED